MNANQPVWIWVTTFWFLVNSCALFVLYKGIIISYINSKSAAHLRLADLLLKDLCYLLIGFINVSVVTPILSLHLDLDIQDLFDWAIIHCLTFCSAFSFLFLCFLYVVLVANCIVLISLVNLRCDNILQCKSSWSIDAVLINYGEKEQCSAKSVENHLVRRLNTIGL